MFHAKAGKMESQVSEAKKLWDFSGVQWGKNGIQKRKREVAYDQENRTEQKGRHHQDRWDHGIIFIYDQSTQNNDRWLGYIF
ncbi:hypothetical protein HZ326_23875 [Fusarium oxysporum f. sp. albedinis]|nr:hypothetical protein HZ326_23875 [Fusarium oxysporum f. sp. albedinis]